MAGAEEDSTKSYHIRDIRFFGSARRILCQSANGPCPLLAICNILLLRNQLKIPQDAKYIDFAELVERVSNWLFDANKEGSGGDSTSSRAMNVRESLSSCLEILPRLNVGLDVNCRFAGPLDFEYTKELAVFDLLDIALYHGWVVSKQDVKSYETFAHLTYNQIVERLIALEEALQRQQQCVASSATDNAGSNAEDVPLTAEDAVEPSQNNNKNDADALKTIEEGLLIKEFMDRTASQLSYDGLLALHEAVGERQLAVFFRNSHFSTMLKYNSELYLLCTDIGFSTSHIVWERLDEVDGDTSYCNAEFQVNGAGSEDAAALAVAEAMQASLFAATPIPDGSGPTQGEQADLDAALAVQMQEEENARAEAALARQHQAQSAQVENRPAPQQLATTDSQASSNQAAASQAAASQAAANQSTAEKDEKKKNVGRACVVQ